MDAARALGISRSTLYCLMRDGRIRYVQIGADRRIPAAELERVATEGVPPKA